ncbi:hypothetical protein HDZ31DRAFT_73895 [Schizophyllum fasciatum]
MASDAAGDSADGKRQAKKPAAPKGTFASEEILVKAMDYTTPAMRAGLYGRNPKHRNKITAIIGYAICLITGMFTAVHLLHCMHILPRSLDTEHWDLFYCLQENVGVYDKKTKKRVLNLDHYGNLEFGHESLHHVFDGIDVKENLGEGDYAFKPVELELYLQRIEQNRGLDYRQLFPEVTHAYTVYGFANKHHHVFGRYSTECRTYAHLDADKQARLARRMGDVVETKHTDEPDADTRLTPDDTQLPDDIPVEWRLPQPPETQEEPELHILQVGDNFVVISHLNPVFVIWDYTWKMKCRVDDPQRRLLIPKEDLLYFRDRLWPAVKHWFPENAKHRTVVHPPPQRRSKRLNPDPAPTTPANRVTVPVPIPPRHAHTDVPSLVKPDFPSSPISRDTEEETDLSTRDSRPARSVAFQPGPEDAPTPSSAASPGSEAIELPELPDQLYSDPPVSPSEETHSPSAETRSPAPTEEARSFSEDVPSPPPSAVDTTEPASDKDLATPTLAMIALPYPETDAFESHEDGAAAPSLNAATADNPSRPAGGAAPSLAAASGDDAQEPPAQAHSCGLPKRHRQATRNSTRADGDPAPGDADPGDIAPGIPAAGSSAPGEPAAHGASAKSSDHPDITSGAGPLNTTTGSSAAAGASAVPGPSTAATIQNPYHLRPRKNKAVGDKRKLDDIAADDSSAPKQALRRSTRAKKGKVKVDESDRKAPDPPSKRARKGD